MLYILIINLFYLLPWVNKPTYICSRIISPSSITLNLHFEDKKRVTYFDEFDNFSVCSKSTHQIDFSNEFLQIYDDKYKISYFIRKAESITVFQREKYLELYTHDPIRYNELQFSLSYFKNIGIHDYNLWTFQKSFLEMKYAKNPELREKKLEEEYNAYSRFLLAYKKEKPVSSDFILFYNQIIQYRILEKRLLAGVASRYSFPKSYIDSIVNSSIKEFDNHQYLFLDSYRRSAKLLSEIIAPSASLVYKYKSINEKFRGTTKEYLLASLLLFSKDRHTTLIYSASEYDKLKTDFLSNCKTTEYREYISRATSSPTIVGKEQLISLDRKPVQFKEKVNKGKITYVDFWASWCAPCRTEMAYSKKLRNEYDKKGINFIYISIDENLSAWENAVKQLDLNSSNCYVLPKGKESDIAIKYKINTIPRYMIFDKSGKIIELDALRPSDTKIRILFNKLLEKFNIQK